AGHFGAGARQLRGIAGNIGTHEGFNARRGSILIDAHFYRIISVNDFKLSIASQADLAYAIG
ncbi:MAG: hypothetical protein LZF84_07790, partial [Nitrosomonas sp.]